jgi:hypothetical protein
LRDGVDQAREIGEAGPTPHELHPTAASLAISAGATVKAIQRMLGHASAAMTLDRYADVLDDELDAARASSARLPTTGPEGVNYDARQVQAMSRDITLWRRGESNP